MLLLLSVTSCGQSTPSGEDLPINENTIMATSKRRPSFIRKSLNKFMTSVKNSSDPISSHTLAITNNNHNNKTPLFCGVCSVVSILTFGLLG